VHMEPIHRAVLVEETIDALALQRGMRVCDGTVGAGGHASLIVERIMPSGCFTGIDRDEYMVEYTRQRLSRIYPQHQDGVSIIRASYADIVRIAGEAQGCGQYDRVLIDLGFSSWHIDASGKGFSFQKNEPLDMRYDTTQEQTAAQIVNSSSEAQLADLIWGMGEDRNARRIARGIVEARRKERIMTTERLARVIADTVPRRGRLHPATKTFQALRIAVNDELGELASFLESVRAVIAPEGRVAVISFHSLEDRMVKNAFRLWEKEGAHRVHKKPVIASRKEQKENPRSRSAKLRVIEIRR